MWQLPKSIFLSGNFPNVQFSQTESSQANRLKKIDRFSFRFDYCLNPISAGVLENQDKLGGGLILHPPSKPHV